MASELLKKIEEDLIRALRDKKELELSVLRMIKASLKNAEIAKRPEPLTSNDESKILKNEAKKHLDSIEMFKRGSRPDLVKKEEDELKIIEKYLPKGLSDQELEKIVREIIKNSQVKDFGKIMGEAMKKINGTADGRKVGETVKKLLNS